MSVFEPNLCIVTDSRTSFKSEEIPKCFTTKVLSLASVENGKSDEISNLLFSRYVLNFSQSAVFSDTPFLLRSNAY